MMFEKLFMNGMVQNDKSIYFTNLYESIICEMSLITGEINTLFKLPVEGHETYESHKELCFLKNKLVIAPCRGNEIIIYDIICKTFTKIKLEIKCDNSYKINQIIKYENYAFLIGTRYPAIIRLDIRTNEIIYITSCYKEYIKDTLGYDENFLTSGDTIGSHAYLPLASEPSIIDLDLNTFRVRKIRAKCDRNVGFNGLTVYGGYLWVIDLNGEFLYKLDVDGNVLLSRNEKCKIKYAYYPPIIKDNKIILLPCNAKTIMVNDLNDLSITYPCEELSRYFMRGAGEKIRRSSYLLLNDGSILINIQGFVVMIWKNNMVDVLNTKPSKELLEMLVTNVIYETNEMCIHDYLDLLKVI